jgi:HEAT repeat protein
VLELLVALARQGSAAARRAAIEAMAPYPGEEADALIREAAADPDPLVQAAACRQLRPRNISHARELLIHLANSPSPDVRAAVREQLPEFTAAGVLAAWEELDEAARTAAAGLVRKLDPQALPVLREELRSPARKRRLRGLELVRTLGLSAELEDELLDLVADEDPHVRAAAAGALGTSASLAAQAALREAQRDSHPAVRQAVATALAAWQEQALSLPESELAPVLRERT